MAKTFDDDPSSDNNVTPDTGFSPAAPAAASFSPAAPAAAKFSTAAVAAPQPSQPAMQQVDTSAFNGATIDPELAKEHWMKAYWRPAMGWLYLSVCAFDFILAPIMWTVVQFWEKEAVNDAFRQWMPLTLQGAGLFHMAMGAVLGIAAWGRTKEKEAGKN